MGAAAATHVRTGCFRASSVLLLLAIRAFLSTSGCRPADLCVAQFRVQLRKAERKSRTYGTTRAPKAIDGHFTSVAMGTYMGKTGYNWLAALQCTT